LKGPGGTAAQKTIGDATMTSNNTSYGYTKTVGEYNKFCNNSYKATLASIKLATTSYTVDDAKNTITYSAALGGM
jgi:hypothetical protein